MGRAKRGGNAEQKALESLIGEDRGALALSAWISVLASLILVAELACIALAIAQILETSSLASSYPYLVVFALLALGRIIADGISTAIAADVVEDVKFRTRAKLTGAIAAISPIDKNRLHGGEAANLLIGHVDALGPYLTRYRPARLRTAVVPVAILVITACFSWIAALVLLITGPLIPVFMALIGTRARVASERQLQEIGSMNAALLDRLQGLTTLRLFDAIPRATQILLSEGQKIRARTMAVLRIAFLSSAVLELFAALGVAFAALYVGFSLLGQFNVGAYGGLSVFGGIFVLMIAPEYFRPLRDFAAAYHDQAAALAASGLIEKLLTHPHMRLPQREILSSPLLSLSIDNVSVELDGKIVLPPFSLRINRGERIALIGPSGSGKSILLALFAGLLEPGSGTIAVNGKTTASCSAAWLGQRPAFVQGSVAANLAMYRPGVKRSDFADALRLAQADEVIAKLEHGYDEILSENASNLSGGEAQRLAIARLALSSAELILADEPTEHLDCETANAVIDGLVELCRERTLIVATHDPRIIARMNRVIDLRTLAVTVDLEAAA
jgi:ATP-binding cassette subfamily C protein CydD